MPRNIIQKWYYDINRTQVKDSNCTNGRAKSFLHENIHKSITRHDLINCYKLLRLLPKDTALDPYILFRFLMILIESVPTERVNKNFVIYLESLLSKLDLVKPDVFIEYLAYFFKNNRIEDARELFSQRQQFMNHRVHRYLPFVQINLGCYGFLLNYFDWQSKISEQEMKFDLSIQGWIVNALDRLRDTSSNYEYFVMCVVKVLIYYGFHKKAYLFASKFQQNNPDNISAQLLLLDILNTFVPSSVEEKTKLDSKDTMVCDTNLLETVESRDREFNEINNFSMMEVDESLHCSDHLIMADETKILNNLRCLDPRRVEILHLDCKYGLTIEYVQDLMDSLEYVNEVYNSHRWKDLERKLEEIIESGDKMLIGSIKNLWQTRYQRLWKCVDFVELSQNLSWSESKKKRAKIVRRVERVLDLLRVNFDESDLEDEVD